MRRAEEVGRGGFAGKPQPALPLRAGKRAARVAAGPDRVEAVAAQAVPVAAPARDLRRARRGKARSEHRPQRLQRRGRRVGIVQRLDFACLVGGVEARQHGQAEAARQRHPFRPQARPLAQPLDPVGTVRPGRRVEAQAALVQQAHAEVRYRRPPPGREGLGEPDAARGEHAERQGADDVVGRDPCAVRDPHLAGRDGACLGRQANVEPAREMRGHRREAAGEERILAGEDLVVLSRPRGEPPRRRAIFLFERAVDEMRHQAPLRRRGLAPAGRGFERARARCRGPAGRPRAAPRRESVRRASGRGR